MRLLATLALLLWLYVSYCLVRSWIGDWNE